MFKKISIYIIISITLNCSTIHYSTKFIDPQNFEKIKLNMSQSEVIKILGDPNIIELIIDNNQNSIFVHTYYIREKVYKFNTIPESNGVISSLKPSSLSNYYGYSKEKSTFKLKYLNEKLISLSSPN